MPRLVNRAAGPISPAPLTPQRASKLFHTLELYIFHFQQAHSSLDQVSGKFSKDWFYLTSDIFDFAVPVVVFIRQSPPIVTQSLEFPGPAVVSRLQCSRNLPETSFYAVVVERCGAGVNVIFVNRISIETICCCWLVCQLSA
uniref:Uncharacterized protein n=1 Tax=Tetraselmis sp. GSL018 TaxID=582737 RepID=A0A061RYN7_9CHLO